MQPNGSAEAIYGEVVDRVNQGVRQFDLVVRLDPSQQESIEQVKRLLIRGQNGSLVRLRDVADIGQKRSTSSQRRMHSEKRWSP